MADIWLDVDTALTEVPVNKVPLVASADGFTIDETIAYNETGMDLNWNFITSAGVFTQTNVVPTTAGVYDWTHQGNGMYTIEIPASGGGSINNDAEGYGWWSGKADAILPFTSPIYGFRAAAINDALCDGGDTLDVQVTGMGAGVVTAAAVATGAIDADAIAADAIDASALATDAVSEITAAIKALVIESQGSITFGQAMSLILSFAAGEASGQDTATAVFKSPNGVATRITATTDGSGNRTAVTPTPST